VHDLQLQVTFQTSLSVYALMVLSVVFMVSLSLWLAYVYQYTPIQGNRNTKPNIFPTVTNPLPSLTW
jgi:hypothetical protein